MKDLLDAPTGMSDVPRKVSERSTCGRSYCRREASGRFAHAGKFIVYCLLAWGSCFSRVLIASTASGAAASTTPPNAHTVPSKQVNRMFGMDLWSDNDLWSELATKVADRLNWPVESSCYQEITYRFKPQSGYRVLGVAPYSLALHCLAGKVREVVIVFANQFDPSSVQFRSDSSATLDYRHQIREVLSRQIDREAETVTAALIGLFGKQISSSTDEQNDCYGRWNWRGNSIRLLYSPGEYTILDIIPSIDHGNIRGLSGQPLRITPLSDRVIHRKNGDVIISGIPMVNQGRLEFCGAACWERYLRYLGIPADMYLLGARGHAGLGGALYLDDIEEAAADFLEPYGAQIRPVSPILTIKRLAENLRKGMPLVWACNNPPTLEAEISKRSSLRRNYGDWRDYTRQALLFETKYDRDFPTGEVNSATQFSHLRLIIGYNSQTQEIAVSDTYGPWAQELWMTLVEANAVSLGYLRTVQFERLSKN